MLVLVVLAAGWISAKVGGVEPAWIRIVSVQVICTLTAMLHAKADSLVCGC